MRLSSHQRFAKPALSYFFLLLVTGLIFPSGSYSQGKGELYFRSICKACHTIGKGRLVGPDLKNVQDRRDQAWLHQFIRSSQSVIKRRDPVAVSLFNEYNKTIMPDQNLSDADIQEVLGYIQLQSAGGGVEEAVKPIALHTGLTLEKAGANEFAIGRKLFDGEQGFTNGGPACISCHTVVNNELTSGGLLALELTNVSTKYGDQGVHSIIASPPFPVMNAAFAAHAVTPDEAFYLTAFLKNAAAVSAKQHPPVPHEHYFYAGIFGTSALFLVYGVVWRKRKRKNVNHSIYKRQLKSI